MTGDTAYILSSKMVKDTLVGMGIIKGSNCTISDITYDEENNQNEVTFEWTDSNGVSHTDSLFVKNGLDGTNVTVAVEEISGGHRITFTDVNGAKTMDVLDGKDASEMSRLNYTSLERLRSYAYRVTFDTIPEWDSTADTTVPGGCSSFVKDGKLYRNLDWDYNEAITFNVVCNGFEGNAFSNNLTEENLEDDLIGQLPYKLVDGKNDYGIMVSTHVLFNDWNWVGTGSTPLYKIPYIILSNIESLDNFSTQMTDILSDVYATNTLVNADYLLQFIVTDGTTTYAILPPESSSGSYIVEDISSNPKLANFRWVSDETVERTDLQTRPTGVERWNLMPCDLSDLRFTKAYESDDRLSEFIGINDTTKNSSDSELEAIYNTAAAAYATRTRNGYTWHTMHSVVYSNKGIEELYFQENFNENYGRKSEGSNVEWNQIVLTGTKIATVTISGDPIDIYVPGIDEIENLSDLTDVELDNILNGDMLAYDTVNNRWYNKAVDYYTKAEIDISLTEKADADDVYTKTEVDAALADKADADDVYTKTEVDAALADKADSDSVYTKTEVDTALADKADTDDVYTKTEVDNLLNIINQFTVSVVSNLPTTNIDTHTIYLVEKSDSETDDTYDEYIYVNDEWEKIGNTAIDLSDYYSKSEVDAALDDKADTDDIVSVSWSQIVTSGTKIAQLVINGTPTDVYAPLAEDGGVDSISQLTDVALTSLSNNDFFCYNSVTGKWVNKQITLGSIVEFAQVVQSGTKIATITIDDTPYDIYVPITDLSNYYTKTEVDALLDSKADSSTTYTKTEVDTALNAKADTTTVYTKTEVDMALAAKADSSTTYTKTEVDTALSDKADSATTYTKTEVDSLLNQNSEFTVAIVDSLPTSNIDDETMYLVLNTDTDEINLYDEYIYVNNAWEKIGTTAIADLSTYYNKSEVDALMNDKADASDIPSNLSDLADDSTHRLVTDTEKSSWNAKADASTTYTKTEVDTALSAKADANTTYTKTEVDTALNTVNTSLSAKADANTTYTKTEVDTALSAKADASTTYTKTEVDTALNAKANANTTYTKTEVDTALSGKASSSHNQSASTITSGTFSGKVNANSASVATLGNSQIRDIVISSTDITAGSTTLAAGTIYLVYETT